MPRDKMKPLAEKNPGYYEEIMFLREVWRTPELYISFIVGVLTLGNGLLDSFIVCVIQVPRLGLSFVKIYSKNLNLYHDKVMYLSDELDDFFDTIKDAHEKGY